VPLISLFNDVFAFTGAIEEGAEVVRVRRVLRAEALVGQPAGSVAGEGALPVGDALPSEL
jgi:hypothetical protein